MISIEKWYILTPLQKMPKNVGDFGKFIVAEGFKKLPKVRKVAQSGHTACDLFCITLRIHILRIWQKFDHIFHTKDSINDSHMAVN